MWPSTSLLNPQIKKYWILKINRGKNNYSRFGQYDVSDKLELRLPKTEINIEIKVIINNETQRNC